MISTTLFVSSGLFGLNQILRKMIQSCDMKEEGVSQTFQTQFSVMSENKQRGQRYGNTTTPPPTAAQHLLENEGEKRGKK